MIDWLRALVRGLVSQEPPPKPRTPGERRSSTGSTARRGGPATPAAGVPRVDYKPAEDVRPSAQITYRRESLRVPRMGIETWARNISRRQKLLVAGAILSVGALAYSGLQGLATNHTLPAAVHGFYTTDEARFAGLAMELRANVVAFKTADSTVAIRRILEVQSQQVTRGLSFRVIYDVDGSPTELRFVWEDASVPEITIEHQGHIVWRRFSANGTMLPASAY